MAARLLIALLVLFYCAELSQAKPLKIASFNIRIFGAKTMSKPHAVDTLKKIIRRYDLVLVQEIRDSANTSIFRLLDVVNKYLWKSRRYGIELSDRLGRSSSKEQYAYLYRKHRVISQGSALYPDSEQGDAFEREPFLFFAQLVDTSLSRVLFIGIHVKPSTADHEIEKLVDVYDEMKVLYDYEDAIIMGDLNADCGYWSNKDEANSLLTKDGRFTIHIDKQQDTTVSNSDCAYDRIITVGKTTGAVSNAAVFKYDAEYKMSQEEALDVSDHYPVEIQLD